MLTGTFIAVAGLAVSTSGSAQAAESQTVFVNTGFVGPTAPGYIKPSAPNGSNVACLTAGTDMSAAVPGCSSTALDSSGDGALRLTSAGNTLEGGVGSTQSVPISKGLDASFDSYQYGGNGADGIVFYLAVTDPYNPQVPTAIGQAGGSLGYSATGSNAGLAHGYLGLGLDAYGNYLSSGFDGTGCSTAPGSSTQPSNVTVRGPGNGSKGYCVLPGYNSSIGGRTALEGTTRASSDVPVEVIVNPAATSTTSAGTSTLASVTVAAMSYAIAFRTNGATSPTVVAGTLPDLRTSAYTGMFPSSWYDPATGLPYKLTYGWVASTGGSTDVHEVNYLNAQTVNGPVPTLTATSTVSSATPSVGSTDAVTISPAVASTGGSEAQPVQVTTTFPSGTTPTAYVGSDYSCSLTGHTQTCTFTGTTAAGAALPPLTLPFTAAGPASSTPVVISSVVSSVDATAVNASSSITISRIPTTTTVEVSPSPVALHGNETITATVSSSPATGTVTFTDTTTGATLCAAATISAGVATCTVATTAPVGMHTITATYSGNATYLASTGAASTAVQAAGFTIGVSASPADTAYGTSSTIAATGVPADATGTVTFTDADGTVLCTAAAATPHCATASSLPVGTYAISATYAGDAEHLPETSTTAAPLTITKATASVMVAVNGDPSATTTYGSGASLSTTGITVGSTGTITFTATTGQVLCTTVLPGTSCPTSATLGAGTYHVRATYPGDANHTADTSTNTATLTVALVPAPAISASVEQDSVAYGDALTLGTAGPHR